MSDASTERRRSNSGASVTGINPAVLSPEISRWRPGSGVHPRGFPPHKDSGNPLEGRGAQGIIKLVSEGTAEKAGGGGGGGLGGTVVEFDAARSARAGSNDVVVGFGTTGSGSAGARDRDGGELSSSVAAAAAAAAVQEVGHAPAAAGDSRSSAAGESSRPGPEVPSDGNDSSGGGGGRGGDVGPPFDREKEQTNPDRFGVVAEPVSARSASVAAAHVKHDPVGRNGKRGNDAAEVSSTTVIGGGGSDGSSQMAAELVGRSHDSGASRDDGAEEVAGKSTPAGSKEGRARPTSGGSTAPGNHGAAADSANAPIEIAEDSNPVGTQVGHMRCLIFC